MNADLTDRDPKSRLVRHVRENRLDLAGLSRGDTAVLRFTLAASALAGLLVLEEAFPLPVPGTRIPVDIGGGRSELIPRFVLAVVCLTVICGVFLLARAMARLRPALRAGGIAVLAIPAASMMGYLANNDDWSAFERGIAVVALVACAAAVVVAPFDPLRRSGAGIAGGLLAVPWFFCLVEVFTSPAKHFYFPDYLTHSIAVLVFAQIGMAVWQVIEGVDATLAGLGRVTHGYVREHHLALLALIALNLAWISAGYAGDLPQRVGGKASEWHSLHEVGWLWLWYGAAAVLLLALNRRRVVSHSRVHVARAVVIAGTAWILIFGVANLLLLAGEAFGPVTTKHRRLLEDWGVSVSGFVPDWQQALIVGAFVIGLLLVLDGRRRNLGIFLALFGFWNLPAAWHLIDSSSLPGSAAGAIIAVDVAISVLVAATFVTGKIRGQQADHGETLLLIVFIIVGAAGPASSIAQSFSGASVFYLGLVAPPLWTFLFASREFRPAHAASPAPAMLVVGITAITLALILSNVTQGSLTPSSAPADLAAQLRLIFIVPAAAFVVLAATAAARRTRAAASGHEAARAPKRRERRSQTHGRPPRTFRADRVPAFGASARAHLESFRSLILPLALVSLATVLLIVALLIHIPRRDDRATTFSAVVQTYRKAVDARRARVKAWPRPGLTGMPTAALVNARLAANQLNATADEFRYLAQFDQGSHRQLMIAYAGALADEGRLTSELAAESRGVPGNVDVWCDDDYSRARIAEEALGQQIIRTFDPRHFFFGLQRVSTTSITPFLPCGFALLEGASVLETQADAGMLTDALATRSRLLGPAISFAGSTETIIADGSGEQRLLDAARDFAVATEEFIEAEPSASDAENDKVVATFQRFVRLARPHTVL